MSEKTAEEWDLLAIRAMKHMGVKPPPPGTPPDLAFHYGFIFGMKFASDQYEAARAKLREELVSFHDHWIDQNQHHCDAIPGGCPVAEALEADAKAGKP